MTSLVFLHGLGGGHHSWDDQLPVFAAQGFGAHAWDQPGYGNSAAVEPYDLEQIAAALARLIVSLDDGPVVLVGHSMGGFVAQETCARHPELVRGLALCFTSAAFGGGSGEFARNFIASRLEPLERGQSMTELAASVLPAMRGSRSDPAALARAERIMAAVPADTYRKAVTLLTTFDRRADLPRIGVPTLLVAGSDDTVAPAAVMQSMAKKIPASNWVLLEGCGHLGQLDQPAPFNAALLAFLRAQRL
ncbi:MAG: alpha/beta fold hydrolase [Betaproteobacteria bacterium]|nr:MAG: alpha/beta fold hydrolase [Betaproteobacteria bacterium]